MKLANRKNRTVQLKQEGDGKVKVAKIRDAVCGKRIRHTKQYNFMAC